MKGDYMNSKQWMSAMSLVALCTVQACTTPPQEVRLDLLGDPAVATAMTRTIVITPATPYVNVKGGEVVKFVVGDQTFAWNFNGVVESFDLHRIAPAGVLDHPVIAYVGENPDDMGGGGGRHHGGGHGR